MNRRGFMKGILAAATAPYVVTTAGVLMPVRALAVPSFVAEGGALPWQLGTGKAVYRYLRLRTDCAAEAADVYGHAHTVREWSVDGIHWVVEPPTDWRKLQEVLAPLVFVDL